MNSAFPAQFGTMLGGNRTAASNINLFLAGAVNNATQIFWIDKAEDVANCSVTSYRYDENAFPRGMLRLELFNFVAPLEEAGAPVTTKPDAQVAAK